MSHIVKEFMTDVRRVQSIAALNELFAGRVANYGIIHFTCANIAGPDGIWGRTPLFGTYESDWMRHYVSNHYYIEDIIFKAGMRYSYPFYWSDVLTREELTTNQRRIIAEAWDGELREGLVVPIQVSEDENAVMSMAGPGFQKNAEVRGILQLMTFFAHKQARKLSLAHRVDQSDPLTARQWEVMAWVAEGKCDEEISQILGISASTVRKHVDSAKEALGASSRTNAAIIMHRRRLLC